MMKETHVRKIMKKGFENRALEEMKDNLMGCLYFLGFVMITGVFLIIVASLLGFDYKEYPQILGFAIGGAWYSHLQNIKDKAEKNNKENKDEKE